jgi:hypothetical protein
MDPVLLMLIVMICVCSLYLLIRSKYTQEENRKVQEKKRLGIEAEEKLRKQISEKWLLAQQLVHDLAYVEHGSPEEQLILSRLGTDEFPLGTPRDWEFLHESYFKSTNGPYRENRHNVDSFFKQRIAKSVRKRSTV